LISCDALPTAKVHLGKIRFLDWSVRARMVGREKRGGLMGPPQIADDPHRVVRQCLGDPFDSIWGRWLDFEIRAPIDEARPAPDRGVAKPPPPRRRHASFSPLTATDASRP
jgi:hypothetical protein